MPPLSLPIDDEDTENEESNGSLELSPFTPPYPPPSSLASSYFPDVVTTAFVNVDYGIPIPLPPPRKKVIVKNKPKIM